MDEETPQPEQPQAEEEKVERIEEETHVFKKVDNIVFGVLSPKMIKKMASAKIVTPELYDKEGYPVDGGLMDVRLGVIDPGLKCKTCGQKLKECPGHFGYIELARPIIHVKFVNIVYNLLRCTCRECGLVVCSACSRIVEIETKKMRLCRDCEARVKRPMWTALARLIWG